MKVVVLGATGTIGLPVCHALCRAGHTVYGVTRNANKATSLIADEIHPIVGDPASSWLHLIPTIDVVIGALGGGDFELAQTIIKHLTSACQQSRTANDPKISYIHMTGTLLYGNNTKDVVSDLSPLNLPNSKPVEIVTARGDVAGLEQAVLKSEAFHGIIVRPGLVYGREGSILKCLFKAAAENGVVVGYGGPNVRYSAVHTDDLADLYLRIAESASLVKGLPFAATAKTFSLGQLLGRLVEV